MKINLNTKVLETNGKPAKMQDDDTSPNRRDMTIRDLLCRLTGSQPATSDAKSSLVLWGFAVQCADESKTEIELSKKQEEILLKVIKNPVTPRGEPLITQTAQAQLLIACGLTEEDL